MWMYIAIVTNSKWQETVVHSPFPHREALTSCIFLVHVSASVFVHDGQTLVLLVSWHVACCPWVGASPRRGS